MLGVDFILNAVVDREHNITNVVAGDVIAAHRQGCKLIAERGKTRVPEKADIVLASAGGFPKDINLYQAHKAMQNAFYFVKEGGIIILVAECREQMGNDLFEDWMFAASSPAEILTRIQNEFIMGAHKAAALAAILDQANVYLVSDLSADLTERLFMTPFAHLDEALKAALEISGENSRLLVLPEAVSTIPDLD
jgi:nickel-dependent lactate racemase